MIEREMEDIIAAYPEEFFPGYGLTLSGRQKTFAGIGRFDLLFKDAFGTNVLMELKAVAAKYENATQLAKYKEALEAQGQRDILMWLVAPSIGTSVREFLDRIGIEYSEIHEAQFRRIAQRHGLLIAHPTIADPTSAASRNRPAGPSERHLDANAYKFRDDFERPALSTLLTSFESVVKRKIDRSLATNLRKELIEPAVPMLTINTVKQLARWCKTAGIYSEGMRVAQDISRLLFGLVIDRHRLET